MTTVIGVIAYGPPFSPLIITTCSLLTMICVKKPLPGLIGDIEKIAITCIFGGLSVEFFINGKRCGSEAW